MYAGPLTDISRCAVRLIVSPMVLINKCTDVHVCVHLHVYHSVPVPAHVRFANCSLQTSLRFQLINIVVFSCPPVCHVFLMPQAWC